MTRKGPRKTKERPLSLRTALGDAVRELRVAADMTQVEAADKAGCNQSLWSKIEKGLLDPPTKRLEQIAAVFEISVSSLIAKAERRLTKAKT